MAEHTPGPWKVDHNRRLEIKQDTGEWSAMIAHVYKSGVCNANRYRMPAEANARLIAAAPQMLEALEAVGIAGDRVRQDLDGHLAAQPGIAGAVDLPHPTGSQRRQDLVRPEAGSRRKGHLLSEQAGCLAEAAQGWHRNGSRARTEGGRSHRSRKYVSRVDYQASGAWHSCPEGPMAAASARSRMR